MAKVLTIVIPAYNVEQYIDRCLKSVTTHVDSLDDLEIIVVNDGSKDNTLELAQRYAVKYPQSVRVIDKPNGGWGSGINRGIEEATGKYLKTLDSDDWFNTANIDAFVSLLKQLEADMILTSFSEVDADNHVREKNVSTSLSGKVMSIDDYLVKNNYELGAPIHTVTYRTAVLQESGYKVYERFYGDLDYITTPLIHVNTIYLSPLNIYQYFLGREGQSVSIAGYNAHIDDFLAVCKKSICFWSEYENQFSQAFRRFILSSTVGRIRWAYILLLSPVYSGKKLDSVGKLKRLDALVKRDRTLYSLTNKITTKRVIPWIYIWRKTGINIFNLSV